MQIEKYLYQTDRFTRLLGNIIKCRFVSHTPICLTHMITDFCNFQCEFCDLWKIQKKKDIKKELTTGEIFDMLDKAYDAGICSYTLWGGEPLLRDDIGEILEYAHRKKFIVSMITNGYFLEQKQQELKDYIDYLIVSIDGIEDIHNVLRNKKDSYRRALEGIRIMKNHGNVIINCVICSKNLTDVDALIDVAKDLNVMVIFEVMQVFPGYNEHLLPSEEQLQKLFRHLHERKKTDPFILNSYDYFRNFAKTKEYTCHSNKVYVTVKATGEICTCKDRSWGSVRDKSFREVFQSLEYSDYCKSVETCNECTFSCVIETSEAYALKPKFFYDKAKSVLNIA